MFEAPIEAILLLHINILSRAGEVGSPTNPPLGSGQRQDSGSGILWSYSQIDIILTERWDILDIS